MLFIYPYFLHNSVHPIVSVNIFLPLIDLLVALVTFRILFTPSATYLLIKHKALYNLFNSCKSLASI